MLGDVSFIWSVLYSGRTEHPPTAPFKVVTSIGLALLLILTGYFLSTWLVRDADPVERAAYALLFGMSAVPLVVIVPYL